MRFIIGPPGSGKTHWCLEQVREMVRRSPMGPPIILLVPEQMSYLTEHALLNDALPGSVRARTFSFTRLAQWVFSQTPVTPLPRLNDIHRRVMVTKIIAQLRRSGDEGIFCVQSIERAVAEMITEMKQCRVSSDDMRRLAQEFERSDPSLARKLADLARVAGEYDHMVRSRFEDPEETLASLRDRLAGLEVLQGAEVFVEGFHGFTPVEMEVLRGLIRRCARVTFTLTIDPFRFDAIRTGDKPADYTRSYFVEETIPALLGIAADEGVKVGEVIALPQRGQPTRFRSPAIAHVQRRFLEQRGGVSFPHDAPEIIFAVVPDERGEARRAVETLLDWRDRHGWNWSEMAVITRGIDRYAQPIAEYLRAARIPFFLDRHEPLETHPLVQGSIAAIEACLSGWRSETILEFAKSALFQFDFDRVARLQRFLESYPQRPARWTSNSDWSQPPARSPFEDDPSWQSAPFDMKEINAIRRAIMDPLMELHRALAASRREEDAYPVVPLIEAICTMLAAATIGADDETQKILAAMGELFDSMITAAGDECLSGGVLLDLVRESLADLKLPRIPPVLDQVMVAQIDRSRLPEVKGAIILGLAEGLFPQAGANKSLLTDRERDELLRLAEAAPGKIPEFRVSARRLFLREGFHAWMAFTRASEALCIVRPLTGEAGQKLASSSYWDELRRLLPRTPVVEETATLTLHRAIKVDEAAAALCRDVMGTRERGFVSTHFDVEPFLRFLRLQERQAFQRVLASAARRNQARLDPALMREYIGESFRTSVSALESHASCPFQYFVRTVLAPEIVEQPVVGPGDTGNLIHAVMKDLTDQLIAGELSFAQIDPDSIEELVRCAFDKPLERLQACGLYESEGEKASIDLVQRQVIELVHFLAEASAQLHARPIRTEMKFGRRDSAEGYTFNLSMRDGSVMSVTLRGQIDRIDLMESANSVRWLAVFDYKLSDRKPDWPQLRDGKSLQLPVYLLVLNENREALAGTNEVQLAGAFYIPIVWGFDSPRKLRGIVPHNAWDDFGIGEHPVDTRVISSAKDPHLKTGSRGDVISAKQFQALLHSASSHVERLCSRILSGEIAIQPAWVRRTSPCGHCSYKAACRLDYSMNSRRSIPALPRAEAIDGWLGNP